MRHCTTDGCTGCTAGGVYGWVGEGYTGYPASLKAEGIPSGAGPGSPCRGLEWVGYPCSARPSPRPPTPDPAGPTGPASLSGPLPASWPIRARFDLFSIDISQNRGVSLKYVKKACRSPYFQNGSQKSPLGFLRFPFWLAFSPKELMVAF